MIYGSAAISLVIYSVALFLAVRILDPRFAWRYGVMGTMIRLLNRMLFLAGMSGLLFGLGSFLSLLLLLAVIVIWLAIYMRRRRLRKNALMTLISLGSERQIPLNACIEAFAAEEEGAIARKAARLARDLNAGMPLLDAVDRNRGALPRGAGMAICVGGYLGRLGPALRELSTINLKQDELTQAILARLLTLSVLLTTGAIVYTFLLWKIVPSLAKIFADFDSELPPMTLSLIDFGDFVGPYAAAIAALIGGATLCYFALDYIGWAPGFGFVRRQMDRGRVLRSLALGAERQAPLTEVVQVLANEHPFGSTRSKLRALETYLRQGADWCESLRRARLIRKGEAAILNAAQRAGNLPWALREVAQRGEERLLYRLAVVSQLTSPVAVLLFGGLVGFVCIASFLPLVKLINELT